jgi:hypothetical protein
VAGGTAAGCDEEGTAVISTPRLRTRAALAAAAASAVITAAGGLVAAAPAHAAVQRPAVSYSFRKLDNGSDGAFNELLGINNHGVISGYYGPGSPGPRSKGYELAAPYGPASYRAENYPGSAQTVVAGLDSKRITVGYYSTAGSWDSAIFGFYKAAGHFHEVVDPAGRSAAPQVTELLGVNNSGVAVGYYLDGNGNAHSFRYNTHTGVFSKIGIGGAVSLTATGINNHGAVTGYFNLSSGPVRSFLMTAARTYKFVSKGAGMSQAFGVNDFNEVVGVNTSGGSISGFTWRPATGFHAVGVPASMGKSGTTWINGVNDAGDLVGFYTGPGGDTNGLLATP